MTVWLRGVKQCLQGLGTSLLYSHATIARQPTGLTGVEQPRLQPTTVGILDRLGGADHPTLQAQIGRFVSPHFRHFSRESIDVVPMSIAKPQSLLEA